MSGSETTGRRRVRRLLMALALVLVVQYLVLPQLAGARAAWELVSGVHAGYLVFGLVLEAASLTARAQLLRSMLPPGVGLGLPDVIRIQLSTKAVSSLVPGGAAAGSGLGFELLRRAGVGGPDAGFALAAQGVGSAVVLNVLLWLALVVSIPLRGFHPLYATAALLGAGLLGGFGAIVLMLTRGEERAVDVVRRVASPVPFLNADSVERVLRQLAVRLRELSTQRRMVVVGTAWAAAGWLLDAAALWVMLAAFGQRMSLDGLLVAYGIANVLAAVPITPGGLGIVEGVMTPLLVGFGAPRGPAILGVVTWRMVNFWLPIPIGALAYLSLRVRPATAEATPAGALRLLAERSLRDAEPLDRWAARYGITRRSPGSTTPGDGE